jgi:hypothetical protein
MTENHDANPSWWGHYQVPVGQLGCWRIGPVTLWIERQEQEWRIAHKASDDHLDPTVQVTLPDEAQDLMALDKVTRFGVSGTDETVTLTPLLADRPIISRPEKPFVVLPEDETTVYISTPLWVEVAVGDSAQSLLEIPATRPSDTWFGPNTMEGELCYAGRTAMRLHLDQLPLRPHRATTAVLIRNRGSEPLTIEKLDLPVMHLSLYQGPDFELWTENVTFERPADEPVIKLRLRDTVGRAAWEGAERLRGPRHELTDRMSVRKLTSLFG